MYIYTYISIYAKDEVRYNLSVTHIYLSSNDSIIINQIIMNLI